MSISITLSLAPHLSLSLSLSVCLSVSGSLWLSLSPSLPFSLSPSPLSSSPLRLSLPLLSISLPSPLSPPSLYLSPLTSLSSFSLSLSPHLSLLLLSISLPSPLSPPPCPLTFSHLWLLVLENPWLARHGINKITDQIRNGEIALSFTPRDTG